MPGVVGFVSAVCAPNGEYGWIVGVLLIQIWLDLFSVTEIKWRLGIRPIAGSHKTVVISNDALMRTVIYSQVYPRAQVEAACMAEGVSLSS